MHHRLVEFFRESESYRLACLAKTEWRLEIFQGRLEITTAETRWRLDQAATMACDGQWTKLRLPLNRDRYFQEIELAHIPGVL